MAKWYVTAKRADFNQIAEEFSISPILARIIRNRDIIEKEDIRYFLKGTLEELHNPKEMKDMTKGVSILKQKIETGAKMRVIGDYDIDGICSTYILLKGLIACGANVDYFIPHRIQDGYGLNHNIIEQAYTDTIDTLITCDNGIAAYEQIKLAKEYNMTVVVTDHHEVPYEIAETGEKKFLLPPADAVIDPKQAECAYPFEEICGAFVAFKVMQELFVLVDMPDEVKRLILEEFIEIVAFATIGDVMDLLDENRIVVKYGLRYMEKTKNQGLRALIQACGIENTALSPYHVGFVLGPCMNAAGRLDAADRALKLLLCEDEAEAAVLAGDLKAFNESRKGMTQKGLQEAIALVEQSTLKEDKVLVVYLPDCHESLAGIIAGRLKEAYHKPAFVLTDSEEGIKGSGRSIESFSMYEKMTQIKDIFLKYGGHKMAAGLTIPKGKEEEFRSRINENANLTEKDLEEIVHIDVPMPIVYGTMEFIEEMKLLEPFGSGNPKPLFAQKDLIIKQLRFMGKEGKMAKLSLKDEETGYEIEGVYFKDAHRLYHELEEKYGEDKMQMLEHGKAADVKISVAYYPDINEFRGRKNLQIVIQNYLV